MSTDIRSQGMTIGVSDLSSPVTYTTIDGVVSIAGPTGTATVIDTTDLSSTAKEKLIGLRDWGSVTLGMKFDPSDATHAAFKTDLGSATSKSYQITFTDASPSTTWTFSGYVTGFGPNAAVDAVVGADLTIEISGDITEA